MPLDISRISFLDVRPKDGDRRAGFEELVCQLTWSEKLPAGTKWERRGPGGDGGVECLARLPNGISHGWQAKFFDDFQHSQVVQVRDSFRQALKTYDDLVRYVVAMPIDLNRPWFDGRLLP